MITMNMPGFTAETSLYRSNSYYGGKQFADSHTSTVIPSIPFCGNCDFILDNCERNNWRPRALCNACAVGNCFSGVEDPTPGDPFTPDPWLRGNWISGGF